MRVRISLCAVSQLNFLVVYCKILEVQKAMKDPSYHLKRPSAETKMILEELYQEYKPPVMTALDGRYSGCLLMSFFGVL